MARSRLVGITRVSVGADGQSCFEDGVIDLDRELPSPPAEPLQMASLAALFGGSPQDVMLVAHDRAWANQEHHPAPGRLLWAILSGEFELTVSGRQARRFGAGAIVLLEDTTGAGHASRIVTEGALAMVLRLPE